MRYIISLLLLICIHFPAESYTLTTYEPISNQEENYNSYPKITNLEKIILKRTYENQDINTRLSRLEKKVCSQTFPNADLAWRVENIISKTDQSEIYNIPSKKLAEIEKQVLGKSYKKDNIEDRLSRLEFQMLGATQSGKPDERFQTLLTASNHYQDLGSSPALTTFMGGTNGFGSNDLSTVGISNGINSNGYSTGFATSGGGRFKNSLKNVFGSFFGPGYITGFTPPISRYGYNIPYGFRHTPYNNCGSCNHLPYRPYNPIYRPSYNRRPTNSYNTIPTWYNSNTSVNSNCSVRILD